ncbi:DNA-deoxyinosine glycosylase [Solitalea koreensis]|uniref:G/U mismatch-specific uracil-DNA glycosylase n=1 Tax=Solitalea koreensis TaxID=543615 RepID=A0A521EL82_9SPHI|nr:DNA-deoxyinosine glycosylase [Solitalea koreensis]SMO84674.1 G/U mismatch-specific uracil-DNA glycosylase [Solitalea koreensis]
MLIEYHPFPPFVPDNCKYLILGSFPGKNSTVYPAAEYWSYEGDRNQFWKILRLLYKRNLSTKAEKIQLFSDLRLANTDIILSCSRKNNSNLDSNLTAKVYNIEAIDSILTDNSIEKIFFTGKGVEREFKIHFKSILNRHPEVQLIALPSPSPAYAALNFEKKLEIYRELLPVI